MDKALIAKTVLITRDANQKSSLNDRLEALGARVFHVATIGIKDPDDWSDVDQVIHDLNDYQWVVFTSANAVRQVIARVKKLQYSLGLLNQCQIAVVGKATANALQEAGIKVDLLPEVYQAENLAEKLLSRLMSGERIWFPRAKYGRDHIPMQLIANGYHVKVSSVYENFLPEENRSRLINVITKEKVDWVIFTSPSTAENFFKMISGVITYVPQLISIGKTTTKAIQRLGYSVAVTANPQSIEGIIEGLVKHSGNY